MYGIRSNIDGSLLMESFIAIFKMQISIFEKEFIIRNPAIFHLKKNQMQIRKIALKSLGFYLDVT